jgi:argininosuccinate synthase
MSTRVVLAYSGGLKASAAIPSLIETHRAQVIAVALDLGQGDDLAEVRQRALAAGALRCHVVDAREEFARDFIVPSLKAGALLEGRYPISTALGRAVIAKTLVTIAHVEDAKMVAHAGTGRDHLRLTGAIHAIDPSLKVVACAENMNLTQGHLADIAERHHIASPDSATHVDRNLWGRIIGQWSDADGVEPPENIFALTRQPDRTPDREASVEIEFARGLPVALNGVPMPPAELIESLTTISAEHGVGRLRRITAREDGRVSRVLYEAPAAVVLHAAHEELQRSTTPGAVQRFVPAVSAAYVDVIDRGEWFSNLRPALDAFVNHVQQTVTGVVRLKLFKGGVAASGISQPATAKS